MKFPLFSFLCFSSRKKYRQWSESESVSREHPERQLSALALPEGICREFSLVEIKAATESFNEDLVVGRTDSAYVYRGTIDDGTIVVAVKRFNIIWGFENFRTEVELLCQLRHPHVISLLGICVEQNELILVYEYLSKGSLERALYDEGLVPPTWIQRLQICIGVARGLHYLHTGAKRAIIHCGINSSNVLLDHEWCPELSDFGFSKMGPLSTSKASIKRMESSVRGTRSYIAPEYACFGELSDRSDVYSFGLLLFELLCGRRASFYWAREMVREGKIYHVIDPYLKGKIAPECFYKYLEVARSCVHYEGNERPAMGEVEVALELALELQKKADYEMEGSAPHGECMYEDALFRTYFDLDDAFYSSRNRNSKESDDYLDDSGGYLSDSDKDASLVLDGSSSTMGA
ncbi:hypothetical protein COLO4_28136 [Corchorus olitorius]|uniref:Protein kinase domain-containing protein n=1 Tax=Corchorus olitorius TaxID=93759 RepID=A0A1R3HMI8_9ROSI|nr:hypothetical protein COLO4_28136 [Corchorus olitorius]